MKIDEVTREDLIQKGVRGARSLVDFRREFLSPDIREVEPAKFHYDWSDKLLFGEESFAIEGFRESGKSTYIVDIYPQYKIFYPDPYINYIVLLKQNAGLAAKSLKEIEDNVTENKWISGKILKVNTMSSEAFEIVTIEPLSGKRMTIRIEAYSKGGSIRGLKWKNNRPSIVLADDLQDEDDAKSQAALDSDWTWFRSEVSFLGQYTRFFMIANNLGEKCIIEQIGKDPKLFGFIFDRVPIISEPNENGIPTWSERFSKEFILDEYDRFKKTGDLAIWLRNRMCIAVSPETQIFKRDDLRWYLPQELPNIISKSNIYISCDLAGSAKKSADYCAFAVIAVDEEDYWYVIDLPYGRWEPTEQFKQLFDTVRKWKPYKVGIETVGQHGGLMRSSINKQMTDERCIFSPVWCTPSNKISKEERIILALAQRVKLGKLVLPEQSSWLSELLDELLMFTREGAKSKHDDLLDSLAQANEFAKPPMNTKQNNHNNNMSNKNLPRSSIGNRVLR